MFQLSADEVTNLRPQFVTSSSGYGGRRYAPYAFTEQGVAMLSSVLNSPRAIAINIEIMRAFVQVRSMATATRRRACLAPLLHPRPQRGMGFGAPGTGLQGLCAKYLHAK